MSLRRSLALLTSIGFASISCGSKGAVALTATVTNLAVAVDNASPLAAQLNGGFDMRLELGQYAPQGTDVALQGNLQLVRPADQSSIVVLNTYPSVGFPYHLEPGGSADIHWTVGDDLGTPGQVVAADVEAALCQAGSVALAGKLTDSAAGNQGTPISGAAVPVMGCP